MKLQAVLPIKSIEKSMPESGSDRISHLLKVWFWVRQGPEGRNKMLAKVINTHFSDVRKGMKYRSQGLNWRREEGSITHVINFQSSRFSSSDELDFTIHIGISRAEVRELVWPEKIESKVDVSECFPSARAGHLDVETHAQNRDLWWRASHGILSDEAVHEVKTYIECKCEQYLRAYSDPKAVLHSFDPKAKKYSPLQKLNIASYQVLYGDREVGVNLISKVAADAPAWSDRTRAIIDGIPSVTG